ncbi:FAD-dependent oxidoreductase [Streptomyces chartreusis]|uniref:FAD-dependent oxidoreductase n=1 Tax=Streptomyces chartreusis TaxID=1969 RepID=UPI00123D603F|nr:NAD(P)/FAD-dependent oxidoreductase [Streptomyces chartreusis]QEV65863.1 FAD-dependent monooxygenase [Streptomyces chartreusis]GGW96021.1 monooxygenase [Streptomyces chartreusis]
MPNVAVIGAGTGGLCLAQALHAAGIEVTVHERHRTPTDALHGYRVRINPTGARALRRCLPAPVWETFLSRAGRIGQEFGFLTERLRELAVLDGGPDAEPHYSAERGMLREVLLTGLEDVVRFGACFERYERTRDGRFECHFADGTSTTADLVVGADGANSRVRAQYLPHARRVDIGMVSIVGRLALPVAERLLPECLSSRPNSVVAPGGTGMFVARHEPGADEGYLMWAYGAAAHRYPADVEILPGEQLAELVDGLTGSWHPALRAMVRETDPGTVNAVPIRTSVPPAAWPATRVTLLGDAIHSMTPLRGVGANMALNDAALLARELTGSADTRLAVGRYEDAMRRDGFRAVSESLRAARMFVSESTTQRLLFKTVLRTASAVPPLRRALFAKLA